MIIARVLRHAGWPYFLVACLVSACIPDLGVSTNALSRDGGGTTKTNGISAAAPAADAGPADTTAVDAALADAGSIATGSADPGPVNAAAGGGSAGSGGESTAASGAAGAAGGGAAGSTGGGAAGSGPVESPLAMQGETVFHTLAVGTFGNVGCAYCHCPTALGGCKFSAPKILGKPRGTITNALATVKEMSVITLTDEQINAVAAYLAYLAKKK